MVRFTRKKIDSLTLGERMKKNREDRRLSLQEVSKSTKIQVKYLEYLEDGEYAKLPADVYVKGFLRSYGIFMGMNEAMLIKQFEREKGIHKNIKKISNEDGNSAPIKFSSFVVTPKMIIVAGIALLVLGSFLYLYNEVNNFVSAPRLVIIKPVDGAVVDGNSVHVVGRAEKDALVFINDQPVLVSDNGEFGEDVGLKAGLNVIVIKARSKFEKESIRSISVNANFETPETNQDIQSEAQQTQADQAVKNSLVAEVYVKPNSTWLSIEADGNLVYNGVLLPESIQKFEANEYVSVTSGNGSETFVKINGNETGSLGGKGVVRDVKYNAGGRVANTQK